MDLYIVLGVTQRATDAEIRRAYRRLARRLHPDINPGDQVAAEQFRQVVDAFETLVDPTRRRRYDAGLEPAPAAATAKSGFVGFDFSEQGPDYSASFGDLMAEVLSERGARGGPVSPGADLHHEVHLSLEEALTGATRPLLVTRRETCRVCGGAGSVQGPRESCDVCAGSGSVRAVRGHMVFSTRCEGCGGTGCARPHGCGACGTTGLEMRSDTVSVVIPAGIADGDRARVPGKGHAGAKGGPAGDLFVTVRVAPHDVFRREGDDLHVVVPVAIHEAALGARIDVPTLDGPARLRVPPGTQSGTRLRLRERGVPSPVGGARGDLLVEVRLMLPRVLDERSKELLREFGRHNAEDPRAPGFEPVG